MTTIAANRKSMAGDTLVDDDGLIYYADKVFKIGDAIIGLCGDADSTTKFLAWFRKECPPEAEGISDDDMRALVLRPSGLYLYSNLCEPDRLHNKFYAIGAGALGAMTAMQDGSTPGQAIRKVMRLTTHTGGQMTEHHLSSSKEKKRKAIKPVAPTPADETKTS